MAVTGKGTRVLRLTADDDQVDLGQKKVKIAGVRLVTVAADSTAQIREGSSTGSILYSLAVAAKGCDESNIPVTCDSGILWLDLSGAAAEVFVYLE
jgi:hypothetical protein